MPATLVISFRYFKKCIIQKLIPFYFHPDHSYTFRVLFKDGKEVVGHVKDVHHH